MKLAVFTAFVTSSLTLPSFSLADTYQTEINASYGETDSDYYYSDNYSISLQGKHYFSLIDTTNLPLAEAAFLQKVSSFSLSLTNHAFEDSGVDGDGYQRAASVTYFIPNSIFFVGAGIAENKSNYEYHYVEGYSYEGAISTDWNSRWNATLGISPIDGLQVWSEFFEDEDVSEYWNLNAKYVKPLSGERAFSVETRYADSRGIDIKSLTVITDYYFNRRFSVGAGITHYVFDDSDDDDNNSFIRARYFITENTSVELSYFSSDYFDSWRIGGAVRF